MHGRPGVREQVGHLKAQVAGVGLLRKGVLDAEEGR
jgi:hypothetical protein